jgi:hypothetical protein
MSDQHKLVWPKPSKFYNNTLGGLGIFCQLKQPIFWVDLEAKNVLSSIQNSAK